MSSCAPLVRSPVKTQLFGGQRGARPPPVGVMQLARLSETSPNQRSKFAPARWFVFTNGIRPCPLGFVSPVQVWPPSGDSQIRVPVVANTTFGSSGETSIELIPPARNPADVQIPPPSV